MIGKLRNLASLETLDDGHVDCLKDLGITNIGDLLAFSPFRYARIIQAAAHGQLEAKDVRHYLDSAAQDDAIADVYEAPAHVLREVGRKLAKKLRKIDLRTVRDLAEYPPFNEAEDLITDSLNDEDDPTAPACVLPRCKKFTRNSKEFVSFFKERDVSDLGITVAGNHSAIANLFNFYDSDCKTIYLGYSMSYLQDWVYCGVHLGEPQGSVSLFMGQDSQISVLDWKRINSAIRQEDSRFSENLTNALLHQRAVDEVARATAEEHQHGSTSAFGANAATAGSFVAAGAIVGGVGGGISGALTGLVLGNAANAAGAAPTLAGAAAGTAIGSVAGAAAGSLVFAGATTLGFVETDAAGDRIIAAESAQNIQQRTLQNSSSIRSFWSNIVSQNVQEEEQRLRTDRVTNHNRIHALNALYFEILNQYRVTITPSSYAPLVFVPFKPFFFDEALLQRYWWIIRTYLTDKQLVLALDDYFTTLSNEQSPAEQIEELPEIGEIRSGEIEVELNLDGSFFEALVATALVTGPVIGIVGNIYEAIKRENILVNLVTTNGKVPLPRDFSPNTNVNYVGRYVGGNNVSIESIIGIEIVNKNAEFTIGIEGTPLSIDVNELQFEEIKANLTVRGKSGLRTHLPNIGLLESEKTFSTQVKLAANRSTTLSWGVASSLRSQYEGVAGQLEDLNDELGTLESTQAKLSNLLGFLNANKFGFTRLILQDIEREQLVCVLEKLIVGGLDLREFAGTNPIGFCGNHVVLPLKKSPHSVAAVGFGIDTSKLVGQLNGFLASLDSNADINAAATTARDFLIAFLDSMASEGNGSLAEKELRRVLLDLNAALETILDGDDDAGGSGTAAAARAAGRIGSSIGSSIGTAIGSAVNSAAAAAQQQLHRAQARILANQALTAIAVPVQASQTSLDLIGSYFEDVSATLDGMLDKIVSNDEVSLPSPAVFMEPVLSQAKGAELYDMRRNSHYEILPAPGIADADPNTLRGSDVSLTPNLPGSNLSIQNAPSFPMPGSITAALAEAGKLDLSTLISSNAATLTSTLDNLSNVATELAKASTTLTGDAQQQALSAAGDTAKQIGDLLNSALPDLAKLSNPARPSPPDSQQEKAEVVRECRRIDKEPIGDGKKRERKRAIGADPDPARERDYVFGIVFHDELGRVYPEGTFVLEMDIFESREKVQFNGGVPLEMSNGHFLLDDVLTLKSGGKVTLAIQADFDGAQIDGVRSFALPANPHVSVRATMLSEKHKVSETNVKQAVDKVIENSNFGAGLNSLLDGFLNAGVKFPFKIFEVDLQGGGKRQLDFKLEYESGSTTDSTTTNGSTTTREFEVIVPRNGWKLDIS